MEPEYIQNPHPVFKMMREQDPVHYEEALGFWIVTRYADVQKALNHPKLVRMDPGDVFLGRLPDDVRREVQDFEEWLRLSLPLVNPPYHTKLRGYVAKAFSPEITEALRPLIQERVDMLLGQLAEGGDRVELLEDYGYKIPTWVIMELLGLPHEDYGLVKGMITDVAQIIGQGLPTVDPVGAVRAAADGTRRLNAYLTDKFDERRDKPGNDLMTKLSQTSMTADELSLCVVIMLIAGTETTTHSIINALYTLLRHPEKYKELVADPSIIETAAEELLRFEGPAPMTTPQLLTADVEIGGRVLEAGNIVFPSVGAANRDPERFENPDELDLRRPVGGVLAFGGGIHFCIGTHLARLEAQIAIGSIVQRFPEMRLDSAAPTPVWRPDPSLRGLLSLPVVLGGE